MNHVGSSLHTGRNVAGFEIRPRVFHWLLVAFWFIWRRFVPQKLVSRVFGKLLETSVSRLFVRPTCWLLDSDDSDQHTPASGNQVYESFQDFFIRKRISVRPIGGDGIFWPCNGRLAAVIESGGEPNPQVQVKGFTLPLRDVFDGDLHPTTPWVVNVYLGITDYHRLHSPCNCTVVSMTRRSGRLDTVNPAFYRQSFQPSFVNERVLMTLQSETGHLMRIAIVGAAFAGSIVILDHVKPGAQLSSAQEIGYFSLGSQVCMTTSEAPSVKIGSPVVAGTRIDGQM